MDPLDTDVIWEHYNKGIEYAKTFLNLNRRNKEIFKKSLYHFSKAIELNPSYNRLNMLLADSYIERGKLYMLDGQYDSAIDNFTKIIEFQPLNSDELYYARGVAYFQKDKLSLAKKDFEMAKKGYLEKINININELGDDRPFQPDKTLTHISRFLEKLRKIFKYLDLVKEGAVV